MIIVDADLLLYAHHSSFSQHSRVRDWLDSQLNGSTRVGLPWTSLLAFLRISTNPKAFSKPEPVGSAWRQVGSWLARDIVWIPEPTERHAEIFGDLLNSTNAFGNLLPDAHLAALALDHGLTLCSADTDFARFPTLRWFNPLAV
ncbi:MAG TPA: TA system VapC family ribonuclease toxin [Rhizomicrobium sp.]